MSKLSMAMLALVMSGCSVNFFGDDFPGDDDVPDARNPCGGTPDARREYPDADWHWDWDAPPYPDAAVAAVTAATLDARRPCSDPGPIDGPIDAYWIPDGRIVPDAALPDAH